MGSKSAATADQISRVVIVFVVFYCSCCCYTGVLKTESDKRNKNEIIYKSQDEASALMRHDVTETLLDHVHKLELLPVWVLSVAGWNCCTPIVVVDVVVALTVNFANDQSYSWPSTIRC